MIKIKRRKTRIIKIGNALIGGNNPVLIQSMVKTKTSDVKNAIRQIKKLESVGCEIVRLAIKDNRDAKALKKIKAASGIPIVADIHFDWRLAIEAINNGADKIRLNPGNIYKKKQVGSIVKEAKLAHIPIRVGLNSGSVAGCRLQAAGYRIENNKLAACNMRLVAKMVNSALGYIRMLESFGFYDIVISLKASDIFTTIEAYRNMAEICGYPFHLGVTATGAPYFGAIKSTVALSVLLLEGIGDTIRVSLTDEPGEEVRAAKAILESLGLRRFGPEIISCPTCGRCEVDLAKIVKKLDKQLSTMNYQLLTKQPKVAIMGCVVNGPGEAKEADIGVAFGAKDGLLFEKGRAVRKISYDKCSNVLLKQIDKYYK